jgi:hypothetical protein
VGGRLHRHPRHRSSSLQLSRTIASPHPLTLPPSNLKHPKKREGKEDKKKKIYDIFTVFSDTQIFVRYL